MILATMHDLHLRWLREETEEPARLEYIKVPGVVSIALEGLGQCL
jgi:hypothetical protein